MTRLKLFVDCTRRIPTIGRFREPEGLPRIRFTLCTEGGLTIYLEVYVSQIPKRQFRPIRLGDAD